MTTDRRAAPSGQPPGTAPCEEIVVPGPITVKPRELDTNRVIGPLGNALDRLDTLLDELKPPQLRRRLPCREDPRHGIMVDARIHDDAAEAHFGPEEAPNGT